MPSHPSIRHLLLDIEGTTCPVSFVAEILFPYAAARLEPFLREQAGNTGVKALVAELEAAWRADGDPTAQTLLEQGAAIGAYLQLLIQQDRKLTPLKDLQGQVWKQGYATGDLVAPLFSDVAPALRRWHEAGVGLAVYSSGSVPAQHLLYGHTPDGDLTQLFSHWFDTRTGAKQEPESYRRIADALEAPSADVLFISDALGECEAAYQSGMAVLFSDRPGNPNRDAGPFERISDYSTLVLEPRGSS